MPLTSFARKIEESGKPLRKTKLEILQVNLGKLCNLTCSHCHVEAGPTKIQENMNKETAEAVIRFLDAALVETLDLTGGAPEMNPNFNWLVQEARNRGVHVIDRCNLTILLDRKHQDLPRFLADHEVEIVASLPCYSLENVDKQRGRGTFDASIEALRLLNQLGYGNPNSNLQLNLVYNPVGPHLPPEQGKLEADYKARLQEDFGISFNHLYTITNMPITRYESFLKATNTYQEYIELLEQSFNPHTIDDLMCKNTLSVGWDGKLYDCDFNQMLSIELSVKKPLTIESVVSEELANLNIATGNHCYGCTAGAGSSCQGTLQAS